MQKELCRGLAEPICSRYNSNSYHRKEFVHHLVEGQGQVKAM